MFDTIFMKEGHNIDEVDSINDEKYQLDDIHQVTKFENMDIWFMNFNPCHFQETCHHGSEKKQPPMKTKGTPLVLEM